MKNTSVPTRRALWFFTSQTPSSRKSICGDLVSNQPGPQTGPLNKSNLLSLGLVCNSPYGHQMANQWSKPGECRRQIQAQTCTTLKETSDRRSGEVRPFTSHVYPDKSIIQINQILKAPAVLLTQHAADLCSEYHQSKMCHCGVETGLAELYHSAQLEVHEQHWGAFDV